MNLKVILALITCSPTAYRGLPQAAGQSGAEFSSKFAKIKEEAQRLSAVGEKVVVAAKTDQEREAAIMQFLLTDGREGAALAERAVALVRSNPRHPGSVEALTWVLMSHPSSPAASQAADLLIQDHLKDPKTLSTARFFQHAPLSWTEKLLRALAEGGLPGAQRIEAQFELATILKTKAVMPSMLAALDDKTVKMMELRFGKEYLASLRAADTNKLDAEALRLFTIVAEGNSGSGDKNGVAARAKAAIYEINNLVPGRTAPEIVGEDAEGKAMKLSDFRGKVVLLDFWGHW